MRNQHGSLYGQLPNGGHIDLNLTSGGRVLLVVNTDGSPSQVLEDLDDVRTALLHLLLPRDPAPRTPVPRSACEAVTTPELGATMQRSRSATRAS